MNIFVMKHEIIIDRASFKGEDPFPERKRSIIDRILGRKPALVRYWECEVALESGSLVPGDVIESVNGSRIAWETVQVKHPDGRAAVLKTRDPLPATYTEPKFSGGIIYLGNMLAEA